MDDLISRQAAIAEFSCCEYTQDGGIDANYAIDFLEQMPSAQTEIVQCKECKWYEGDIMGNPWGVCCHDGWTSGNIGHEVSESGWCYRAERRTDATD